MRTEMNKTLALAALMIGPFTFAGCGGDQKEPEEPDTSQEVREAGEAAGEEVEEGAKDVKEGTENAVEETREEVENKDLDGDGDK
jgi:hypothetical protein